MNSELRKRGIGGSEIGALCGVSSYCTPFGLYAKKKDLVGDAPVTARQIWGKRVEPFIAADYATITGRRVMFSDETRQHEEHAVVIGTPDALCINERRGVECKLVSPDQYHRWAEDVPLEYQAQVYWYMLLTGYPLWDIAVQFGFDRLAIFEFQRDFGLEQEFLEAANDFWSRFIVGDEQPRVDASDLATEYLRRRFPANREPLRRATETELDLLRDYTTVREIIAKAGVEKDTIENQLKEAVGDADGIAFGKNGHFTWKKTKDTVTTDWQALAARLMASLPEDERLKIKAEFTEPKPGQRRIHFYPAEEFVQKATVANVR